MQASFIIVLFIAIFGVINSAAPLRKDIWKADAKEIGRLFTEFWSTMLEKERLDGNPTCKVLSSCCSNKDYSKELSKNPTSFSSDPIAGMIFACLGSVEPSELANNCPAAAKIKFPTTSALKVNPGVSAAALNPMVQQLQEFQDPIQQILRDMAMVCETNHIFNYLCRSDRRALQTCLGSILDRELAKNGFEKYSELQKTYKTGLIGANNAFAKAKANAALQQGSG